MMVATAAAKQLSVCLSQHRENVITPQWAYFTGTMKVWYTLYTWTSILSFKLWPLSWPAYCYTSAYFTQYFCYPPLATCWKVHIRRTFQNHTSTFGQSHLVLQFLVEAVAMWQLMSTDSISIDILNDCTRHLSIAHEKLVIIPLHFQITKCQKFGVFMTLLFPQH